MPLTTVAFFGATGGCALAALARTLEAGINATALARTPTKLQNLLTARGISATTISKHLTIIPGNVRDRAAVTRTLLVPSSSSSSDDIVPLIISGIGGSPKLRLHLYPFTLDDPTICADATQTIFDALIALRQRNPHTTTPVLVTISSTGVSRLQRDVPILFLPIYHWMLWVAHADKRNAEALVEDIEAWTGDTKALSVEGGTPDSAANVVVPIAGFIIVRPSLLLDGPAKLENVRVGWEGKELKGCPAVGYTISRESVGAWLFEEVVKEKEKRETWLGKKVTLTE